MGETSQSAGADPVATEHGGEGEAITSNEVGVLLAAAGLDPPEEEVERLASLYPALRRTIERFHAVDAVDDVMAAVFRADEVTAAPVGAERADDVDDGAAAAGAEEGA